MTVEIKLKMLRSEMTINKVDAVIVPSSDPHQSEYVAAHWQERTWISGFTGSAGTVVITQEHAGLWTDSRYFLQAEQELKGSSFELHKMYNQFAAPYLDFINENLSAGSVVAINGWMFAKANADHMRKQFDKSQIRLQHRHDLISKIWSDRPPLSSAFISDHPVKYAGLSRSEKLDKIRMQMKSQNVDYHFISSLDDIAWTFNIRGKDVDYNPVVICYAIIEAETSRLFIDSQKIPQNLIADLKASNVQLHAYTDLIAFVNNLSIDKKMLIDKSICSAVVYEAINCTIVSGESIPKVLKAIKSEKEVGHIRNAMTKDGAALANAFYWLEQELNGKQVSECEFAEKIAKCRSEQENYVGESFGAIIGYESNGAIIHYHPEPETCKKIKAKGILLADSGGQYLDGTTDITRTISLSKPTAEQKKHYTLILKGMVALSMAKFPEGTAGAQLDTIARQFLWAEGLNYLHGTGHGVGYFLNVHEPPQGFAPPHSERGKTIHVPGMLTSNEPGYYIDGKYGMRIENLILTVQSKMKGFLAFETLTLYPFDHNLIEKSLLSDVEVTWINDYHNKVYKNVSSLLNAEVSEWFKVKCAEL
ncbi:MAG: aminopeptidase P family protein [Saprospiraceae bacterium]|nr:aminopeptidase P family protein [Saprospiraceae bacterium]